MTNTNNTPTISKRKPHNDLAGYVCERKHASGGHLVLFEAAVQGIDAGEATQAEYDIDGNITKEATSFRWIVLWMDGPDPHDQGPYCGPGFTSQRAARAFLKYEASGPKDYDWGGLYSDGSTVEGYAAERDAETETETETETLRAERDAARAEVARMTDLYFHSKGQEPEKVFDCSNLDNRKTIDGQRHFAHGARNAAAVAAHTFAVWCERRAEAEPTEANQRQAKAARQVAELAANVGYAR